MNNKKIKSAIFAVVIGAFVASPALAMMEAPRMMQSGTDSGFGQKIMANVCSRLGEFSANREARWNEMDKKLENKRQEKNQEMEKRRLEAEQKMEQKRLDLDAKRLDGYEKLSTIATTDEQKQAVEQFKEAVEAAVVTRRAAVELANSTHHAQMEQLMSEHKNTVEAHNNSFREEVQNAEGALKEKCNAGDVDFAQMRSQLQAQIKEARDRYKQSKNEVAPVGDSIKEINDAHKDAIQKAVLDFKTALADAKLLLKSAFPVAATQ